MTMAPQHGIISGMYAEAGQDKWRLERAERTARLVSGSHMGQFGVAYSHILEYQNLEMRQTGISTKMAICNGNPAEV
jgi:hypothetical protein